MAGEKSLVNINEVLNEFKGKVDCMVEEKEPEIGVASTIVRMEGKEVKILREGPIPEKSIKECL